MSNNNYSNKVQETPQYNYNHLKIEDCKRIIEQLKIDYENCLIKRIQTKVDHLKLTRNGYQKPRAVEFFSKYVDLTETCLKLDLPKSRIVRVDHLSKTLLFKLKEAILARTTSYLPHPNVSEYDKLLKRAFTEETNHSKIRAYISPSKLSKYVK